MGVAVRPQGFVGSQVVNVHAGEFLADSLRIRLDSPEELRTDIDVELHHHDMQIHGQYFFSDRVARRHGSGASHPREHPAAINGQHVPADERSGVDRIAFAQRGKDRPGIGRAPGHKCRTGELRFRLRHSISPFPALIQFSQPVRPCALPLPR